MFSQIKYQITARAAGALASVLAGSITLAGCATTTSGPITAYQQAEQLRRLEASAAANGQQVKVLTITVKSTPFHWTSADIIVLALILSVCLICICASAIVYWRAKARALQTLQETERRQRDEVERILGQLRDRMTLPSLVELNRLTLTEYHSIATNQAQKSFRSGQRAILAGFTWMIACFTAVIIVDSFEGKLITAALAPIGGILAGFLGRTYIHVYERSLVQLNQYYSQPLVNSYYLAAERLAEDMSESAKDKLLERVVEQLLATAANLSEIPNKARSDGTRSRIAVPRTRSTKSTDSNSQRSAPTIDRTE